MNRFSEVIGLPVICVDHGKKIGTVKDIIACPAYKEVRALLLEKKSWELSGKVIMLRDIVNLGTDAVIVDHCSCITELKMAEKNGVLMNKGEIRGLRIYSKSGEDLGVVKDVLFDYKTGIVEGVEVSDGLLQDIIKGRSILPLFGKVEFSRESILVDKEAIEERTDTGGGLSKILLGEEKSKKL